MKIAIVGSRTFNEYFVMDITLRRFHISKIISGGAKGADSLAELYAQNNNIPIKIFKPDWDKYGNKAGFIRNQKIIDECDIVLAFWDGKSNGTKDSINKAKITKKPTFIVYF